MQENKRSTLSVPLPSTLSSPIKANDIRLAHDPLDMDTLLVWLRMDTSLPHFVRPAYGDLFPGGGWTDPATKTVLYAAYQCCNVHEVDKQYMEFCYRLLPSSSSFYYKWQSYTNLSFPDTLVSVTASYNYSFGNGSSSHPDTQQGATATGSHGNVTANPRASAEGSVSIIPEITPVITSIDGRNLEMTNLSFEVSKGASLNDILLRATSILGIASQSVTVTSASPGVVTLTGHKLNVGDPVFFGGTTTPPPIVAGTVYYVSFIVDANKFRVSATKGGADINTTGTGTAVTVTRMVRPMPIWKPKMVIMSAFGQQGSVSVDAETNAGVNWSDDFANYGAYFDYGSGSSYKMGVNNRTMTIPPTIHGAISVAGLTFLNAQATVAADASTNAFTGTPGTLIAAIPNATGTVTLTITGSVSPTTIAATSPPSVPTDGFYLAELNPQIHPDQLLLVHCGVVDFSQLA